MGSVVAHPVQPPLRAGAVSVHAALAANSVRITPRVAGNRGAFGVAVALLAGVGIRLANTKTPVRSAVLVAEALNTLRVRTSGGERRTVRFISRRANGTNTMVVAKGQAQGEVAGTFFGSTTISTHVKGSIANTGTRIRWTIVTVQAPNAHMIITVVALLQVRALQTISAVLTGYAGSCFQITNRSGRVRAVSVPSTLTVVVVVFVSVSIKVRIAIGRGTRNVSVDFDAREAEKGIAWVAITLLTIASHGHAVF